MLRLILPAGLVGIVLGWLLFNQIQPKYLGAMVGATAIGFVMMCSWQALKAKAVLGFVAFPATDGLEGSNTLSHGIG